MIERIMTQQQPLCTTLLEIRRGDLMPSEAEFVAMECFIMILKPLVEITETMGAKNGSPFLLYVLFCTSCFTFLLTHLPVIHILTNQLKNH